MSQNSSEQAVPEITCWEVVEWTSAYIDEHLDDPFKVRMALHLAACADCRVYLKQVSLVRNAMTRLPNIYPSPVNRLRLRQHFAAVHPR